MLDNLPEPPDSQDSYKKTATVSPQKQDSENEIFHLAGKKTDATGWISDDGFTVCKGSGFCLMETKSCPDYIRLLRAQLVTEGKVKDGIFTQNVYFNSLSTAAACIIGGTANGNIMWLNADGKTIKELKGELS